MVSQVRLGGGGGDIFRRQERDEDKPGRAPEPWKLKVRVPAEAGRPSSLFGALLMPNVQGGTDGKGDE